MSCYVLIKFIGSSRQGTPLDYPYLSLLIHTLLSSASLCPPSPLPSWGWSSENTWMLPIPLASSWVQSMRSTDGNPGVRRKRSVYLSAFLSIQSPCCVPLLKNTDPAISLLPQPHSLLSSFSSISLLSVIEVAGICPWLLSVLELYQLS